MRVVKKDVEPEKNKVVNAFSQEMEKIDKSIEEKNKLLDAEAKKLGKMRRTNVILFLTTDTISRPLVSALYKKYREFINSSNKNIDVIVDSGGGDIDAAYHLVDLFRKIANNGKLTYIIPRWAKSAATLLACGGDEILMELPSEFGPLDPQISIMKGEDIDELEIEETFSPLCIEPLTNFIHKLYKSGNSELADKLSDKIKLFQLGEYLRSLNVSPIYLTKILKTRMLKDVEINKIKGISEWLTTGHEPAEKEKNQFPSHGHCILMDDLLEHGLNVKKPTVSQWNQIWKIWETYNETRDMILMKEMLLKKLIKKIGIENLPNISDMILKTKLTLHL